MESTALVSDVVRRSGLSKAELSRRSGISRALLDAYLKGAKQPTLRQVSRLADAAGLYLHIDVQPVLKTPPALIEVLDLADHLPRHRPEPLPHTAHIWSRRRTNV